MRDLDHGSRCTVPLSPSLLFLEGVVGSLTPSPGLWISKASIAFSNPQYNLRIATKNVRKEPRGENYSTYLLAFRLKVMLCGAICLSQWSTMRYDARSFGRIVSTKKRKNT